MAREALGIILCLILLAESVEGQRKSLLDSRMRAGKTSASKTGKTGSTKNNPFAKLSLNQCHYPPPPMNGGIKCKNSSVEMYCEGTCREGYRFPDGSESLRLNCYTDRQWEPLAKFPDCEPNPHSRIYMNQCQYPPPPMNGGIKCRNSSMEMYCEGTCREEFRFPDGSESLRLNCNHDGHWEPQAKFPDCEPNPYHRIDLSLCQYPPAPSNGGMRCRNSSKEIYCVGTCSKGFRFPDGSESLKLDCKPDGQWHPLVTFPDCEPICDPPCQNGGTCFGDNRCLCIKGFWGENCESSISVCDTRGKFNGDVDCKYSSVLMECTFKCPRNQVFEHEIESPYTCDPSGTWNHPTFPRCITVVPSHKPEMITKERKDEITKGRCFTWKQNHFKTFDGLMYEFEGSCTYLLVKECTNNLFAIHMQMDRYCRPTCSPKLFFYFGSNKYTLETYNSHYQLLWNSNSMKIPGIVNDLVVEQISDHLIVKSTVGFTVIWDGSDNVVVEVNQNLWNNTCGLCGRFDGIESNDLENSNGKRSSNELSFVNSWKMDSLEDSCPNAAYFINSCPDPKLTPVETESRTFCRNILSKVSSCRMVLDPLKFIEACVQEQCNCRRTNPLMQCKKIACSSISAYFQECLRLGVTLSRPWRNAAECPKLCPPGMKYKDCGSSCPHTCQNPSRECVEEFCVGGCFCAEGMLYYNNTCYQQAQCPCLFQGREYNSGSMVHQDCNNCMCVNGKWECTKEKCEARCSSVGDPHYVTFDGKHYDFMGTCSYYLLYHPNYSVEQENYACNGDKSLDSHFYHQLPNAHSSCIRSVIVRSRGSELRLKQGFEITLNGREVTQLPTSAPGLYVYMASSMFVKVELSDGLIVLWDGVKRLYLDAPPALIGQTRGLCGTYTLTQKDDFLTPEGDVEVDINSFANKWKAEPSCNELSTLSLPDPCVAHPEHVDEAKRLCGIIKSTLFSNCHELVDPEVYYDDCMYDMCSCNSDVTNCLCPSVANFAALCSKKGSSVDWRAHVKQCSVICTGGQVYSPCSSSCQHSCLDIASNPNCPEKCVEGCNCPSGLTLNSKGECIPINLCTCLHNNQEYPAGYVHIEEKKACECINARWECREARIDEIEIALSKLPSQPLCSDTDNMEYTDCESDCPHTCSDLKNVPSCTTAICKPGCRCKRGYILDAKSKRCVKPEHCPCHHGDKTYAEGEMMRENCNLCVCSSGRWSCDKKECPGICTIWGDTHVSTFDGRIYDFKGDCEYTILRADTGKSLMTINVQNMPCGASGVACFREVSISLGDEQLILSKEKPLPSLFKESQYIVRKVGLFVVVHTNIGITVYWDKGTQVHVRVNSVWEGKVQGLCGDYNGNEMDDFQTPLGGPTVAHPNLFADSWKAHDSCVASQPYGDNCASHVQRQNWAISRCSVLHSDIFKPCHFVVPVQPYYERCINDACGCDSGGDCECLCTAIAAYAQECNIQKTPIHWRSQDLCPIQCETCDKYEPCISVCPKLTCETEYLYKELEKVCQEEMCVEGCDRPPCSGDEIFNNDHELKCIPLIECIKQPCKVINGKMYHEGETISDLTIATPGQSCHCIQGNISCKGQPTLLPPTTILTKVPVTPVCIESGFTEWINSFHPSYENGGDYELLEQLINEGRYNLCPIENIVSIVCRSVRTQQKSQDTGQIVHCSLPTGLICENSDQIPNEVCDDYEISVYCDCAPPPSTEFPPKPPPVECTAPGWTYWMNSGSPSTDGESETLVSLREKNIFCESSQIENIECREVKTKIPHKGAQNFGQSCTTDQGYVCLHSQTINCPDVEVRFYCQCDKDCDYPRGMEKGFISDEQISESSSLSKLTTGKAARLHSDGAWSPAALTTSEWLQIDLEEIQEVSGITTQGNPKAAEWVTYYKIEYSQDGQHWKTVKDINNEEMFFGNVDGTTPHTNSFKEVTARYIKIIPKEWINWISMRIELLGCNRYVTPVPTTVAVPITNATEFMKSTLSTVVTPRVTLPPIITVPPTKIVIPFVCEMDGWIPWMNMDSPLNDQIFEKQQRIQGDNELISELHYFYPFCDDPTAIKCRTVDTQELASTTKEVVKCDLNTGLSCRNEDQTNGLCRDYEISVYCQCEKKPCYDPGYTSWFNSDHPNNLVKADLSKQHDDLETFVNLRDHFEFCKQEYLVNISCRDANSHKDVTQGEPGITCDVHTGLICDHTLRPSGNCEDYEVRFYCLCLSEIVPSPSPRVKPINFTTQASFTTFGPLACDQWTPFINNDNPYVSGEHEEFGNFESFNCSIPTRFECVEVGTNIPWNEFDVAYVTKCGPEGIHCIGDECPDLQIRVFCACPTTSPTPITRQPLCISGWTNWFDIDNPESGGGDFELIENLHENFQFCAKDKIVDIECKAKTVNFIIGEKEITEEEESYENGNPVIKDEQVKCDKNVGLECFNSLQPPGKICQDYEIRLYCDCEGLVHTTVPALRTVPTTGPTTSPLVTTPQATLITPVCNQWTDWYNEDTPYDDGEEIELFAAIPNFSKMCPIISQVECVELYSEESHTSFIPQPTCDKDGFVCKTDCLDFKIRAFCQCEGVTTTKSPEIPCKEGWTDWFDTDNPDVGGGDFESVDELRKQYKICGFDEITNVECGVRNDLGEVIVGTSSDVFVKCNKFVGLACYNENQENNKQCEDYSIRFYCSCGPTITMTESTIGTTPTAVLSTRKPGISTTSPCPPGYEWNNCAYDCNNLCNAFFQESLQRGYCTAELGNCIPGCINEVCSIPKYWRDESTCVDEDECTCLLEDGTVMPPLSVKKTSCSMCQCRNNTLECSEQPGCRATETGAPHISTEIPGTTPLHRITIMKEDCWTEWINTDLPSSGLGDFERVSVIRQKYDFCENPIKIECRDSASKINYEASNQNLQCDVDNGLICQNNQNGKDGCLDYEIRFFCPCVSTSVPPPIPSTRIPPVTLPAVCKQGLTDWFSAHVPDEIGEYEHVSNIREHHSFCSNENITAIHCREKFTGISYDQSDDRGTICTLQEGFICRNSEQANGKSCSDYEIQFLCDCGVSALPSSTSPATSAKTSVPTIPPSSTVSVEITFPTTGPTVVPGVCNYWSEWINEDQPTSGDGDKEYRSESDLNKNNKFCLEKSITDIQCLTADSKISYNNSGDNSVICNVKDGLYCENNRQTSGKCHDYMIRYYCSCEVPTTEIITFTPSTGVPVIISPCEGEFISLLKDLPDSNLKASSSISSLNGPQSARLNSKVTDETGGAWTAEIKDKNQFLQIDLGHIQPVYGIITQGHDTKQEWVKDYTVSYSRDGQVYVQYPNADGTVKVFGGNYNNRDQRKHIFQNAFEARFIRIQPKDYQRQISLRVDLLGCSIPQSTTTVGTTLFAEILSTTAVPLICNEPMGFENMKLSDDQITVSSSKGDFYSSTRIRLNTKEVSTETAKEKGIPSGSGGWIAEKADDKQFVQIDFTGPRTITGIVTQGRDLHDQWVKTYKIKYSNDGENWNDVTDKNGETVIFDGNSDSDTPVTNYFEKSIRARFIKLIPLDWNQWIAMRLEVKGCYEPYEVITPSTPTEYTTEGVTKKTTPRITLPTLPTEYILNYTGSTPRVPTTLRYLCLDEMGLENGQISDDMITVSSTLHESTSDGSKVRLNTKVAEDSEGGWVAEYEDEDQFVQIDFRKFVNLTGIKTQGRDNHDEWVKKFIVLYSDDGINWNKALNVNGNEEFEGNEDSSTSKTNMFKYPIETRFLKIVPLEWNNWISMRLEIIGCFKPYPTEVITPSTPTEYTTEGVTKKTTPGYLCLDKMGLENGQISDDMITVSSTLYESTSDGSKIRLNTETSESSAGGWVAEYEDQDQFVQIDFRETVHLTGILTQGRDDHDEWVKKFIIVYSDDGITWSNALNADGDKEFEGNVDFYTPKINMFENPIEARYLKIIPLEWNNWISMRLEIIGCFKPYPTGTTPAKYSTTMASTKYPSTTIKWICKDPMGLENGLLKDSQIYVSSSLHGSRTGAVRIRLNTPEETDTGGWVAQYRNSRQYVQFDFRDNVKLTGIVTQGRNKHNEWVKTYKVKYSTDGIKWFDVLNKDGEKTFTGNFDENTPVTNQFEDMITTRFLKIIPVTWNNWISMRAEILGCFTPPTEIPPIPRRTTEKLSTIPITPTTEECVIYGEWINLDRPSLSDRGDYEPIQEVIFHSNMCSNPITVECREVMTHQKYSETGQTVSCNLEHGLDCQNGGQTGQQCFDYEVRIGCYICGMENVTTPSPALPVCPEVPKELVKNCPTSCPEYEMCDGEKCVPSLDCACYAGGKKYSPGDRVETKECHDCFCQVGGYSHCVLKTCPSCEEGRVSKLLTNCHCECEGCSKHERLCVTNGECIPEDLWCDGVVDCPDDERFCVTTTTGPSCPEVPIPTCGPGYYLYRSESDDGCPLYECVPVIEPTTQPPPPELQICTMDVKNFKTFDGSEYTYETCHHILMQDKVQHNFNVTVHKDCLEFSNQCVSYILIHQDSHKIKITRDLHVEYNSQEYKSSQLIILSQKMDDFSIRVVGNSVIFISKKYSFEVKIDTWLNVQIKVGPELLNQVNGLCGSYSQDPSDDFEKKDGQITQNTDDFGDSWSVDSNIACEPELCEDIERRTLIYDTCAALNKQPFDNCHPYINPLTYMAQCMSSMCHCLSNNKTMLECQCEVYTQYTIKCLNKNPAVNINEWRYLYGCVPKCPPGKEWKDCGPVCERTCDNLHENFSSCDTNECVAGCFCPPGFVKKDDQCIEKYKCEDCICNGYGDPHYYTFDRTYYPFQGNCTYVLSRYIDPKIENSFEVFATNEDCKEEPNTTCTVAVMVYYNGHLVHFRVNESVSIDGVQLYPSDFPFNMFGFNITSTNPPGRSIVIRVEAVHLEVRYFELNYGFEVRIPSDIYYDKTEGLCGNCDYDKSDDIKHKDGYLTNDTDEFALSWLASPPEGIESISDICKIKPKEECTNTDAKIKCRELLSDKFAPCHLLVDPHDYIQSCEFDVCHSVDKPHSLCRSLTEYARKCAEVGVCLENWRSDENCPATCPEGMHYEQCKSPCMVTCENKDSNILLSEECMIRSPVEGCVCNGNLVLKDGVCVEPFMCDTCDEEGHVIGDTWKPNSCISCRCTPKLRVECLNTEICNPPPICNEDEKLVTMPADNDTCCPVHFCIIVPPPCPEMDVPDCPKGEVARPVTDNDGCLKYNCECDVLKCKPISEPSKLDVGEIVVLNTKGCCPVKEIACMPETCPEKPKCNSPRKLVVRESSEKKCCPEFDCKLEDMCDYLPNFRLENGIEILDLDQPYEFYKPGQKWKDGNCAICVCEGSVENYEAKCDLQGCPITHYLEKDYELEEIAIPYTCCPEYKKVSCKDDDGNVREVGETWSVPGDKCSFYQCLKSSPFGEVIKMKSKLQCDDKCQPNQKYVESPDSCCGRCEDVACLDENGRVHQVGDKWKNEYMNCYDMSCNESERNGINVVLTHKQCPPFPDNCPVDKIEMDEEDCCKICTAQLNEICQPEELNLTDTIKMFRVKHKGQICTNKKPIKKFTQCSGKCESHSIYSAGQNDYASTCSCCTPSESESRVIELECTDKTTYRFTFQQPLSCSCTPCTGRELTELELPKQNQ